MPFNPTLGDGPHTVLCIKSKGIVLQIKVSKKEVCFCLASSQASHESLKSLTLEQKVGNKSFIVFNEGCLSC